MRRQSHMRVLLGVLLLLAVSSTPLYAVAPSSTSYRFDETSVGTDSLIDSSSTNFRASGGATNTTTGPSSSTNFQTETGSNTSPDPNLTFVVNSTAANFGTFSATTARTSTATFSVTNYTSFGYVVQVVGDPPKFGNNVIDAMATNATSQTGVEQFGINLAANTSPTSFGANPNNGTAPNNFGFGSASANYSSPNQFRYVSGETIASAPKSSGKTDYTLSYLVNVAVLTPGGIYNSDQTLVVTGTY